ncbi:MAG: hypothetical protein R8K53_00355, partial [Mariprofundaceae bacterium]
PLPWVGQEQVTSEHADGPGEYLYVAKKIGLLRHNSAHILPIWTDCDEKEQIKGKRLHHQLG